MFTSKQLAQGKQRAREAAKSLHYRVFLVVRGNELLCTLVPLPGDVPILRAGLGHPLYAPPQEPAAWTTIFSSPPRATPAIGSSRPSS